MLTIIMQVLGWLTFLLTTIFVIYVLKYYNIYQFDSGRKTLEEGVVTSLLLHWNYVELQKQNGGPDDYREALATYIRALDHTLTKVPNSELLTEKMVLIDKMLAYTRLADLDHSVHQTDRAKKYKTKAISLCKKAQWDICTYDRLLNTVRHLDKSNEVILPSKKLDFKNKKP